jgi:hypothetical protein
MHNTSFHLSKGAYNETYDILYQIYVQMSFKLPLFTAKQMCCELNLYHWSEGWFFFVAWPCDILNYQSHITKIANPKIYSLKIFTTTEITK